MLLSIPITLFSHDLTPITRKILNLEKQQYQLNLAIIDVKQEIVSVTAYIRRYPNDYSYRQQYEIHLARYQGMNTELQKINLELNYSRSRKGLLTR
jgi:hypothetical protein